MRLIFLFLSMVFSLNSFAYTGSQEGFKLIVEKCRERIELDNEDFLKSAEKFKLEATEFITENPLTKEEIMGVLGPMFKGIKLEEVWQYQLSAQASANPLELLQDEALMRHFGAKGANWTDDIGRVFFINFAAIAFILINWEALRPKTDPSV